MILLTACCLLALILLVWFKSDAFVEYAKLFRVQNFFFVPLFEKEREKDPSLDYLGYLSLHHECFFVKLINCVLCLGFWLALFISLHLGDLLYLPLIYIGGLILYGITAKVLE